MTGGIGRDHKMIFSLLSVATWGSFAIENDQDLVQRFMESQSKGI